MDPKIDTFGQVDTRDLAILVGIKKVLVDQNWTQKSTLLANLTPVIWQFWGKKNSFLAFFKVFLELFRKCLGSVFVLKRPTCGCINISKR